MGTIIKRVLYLVAALGVVSLVGCAGPEPVREIGRPIKGMGDITDAIAALDLHRNNVLPLSASGDLKYFYFENGKKKPEPKLDSSLRFAPPKRLYFGSKSIVGEAIRLGSNDDEFWFQMKPKEISKYWWGKWSQLERCPSNLLISPESMLDALGMVKVDRSWLLIDYKGTDALVKIGTNGMIAKKIFVNRRGYVVSRIEYYDKKGLIIAAVDIDDYRHANEGSPVPAKIDIATYNTDSGEVMAKIEIRLKNLKFLEPGKIGKKLFVRPEPKGFKDVYVMGDNCKFDYDDNE